MDGWELIYHQFEPEQEALREALCTLGNGYFAARGAAPESQADEVHYPGMYLAGCYNRLETTLAGRSIENESLVNMPNWLVLRFRIDNAEWFDIRDVEILAYRQTLDIRRAMLLRHVRFRDAAGRITRLDQQRLVHISAPHLAAMRTELGAENWSGSVEIETALDGRVRNNGVARYRDLNSRHLNPLCSEPLDNDSLFLEVETNQSHIRVALAARTWLGSEDRRLEIRPELDQAPDYIAHRYRLEMTAAQPLWIEKNLAVYTSRDHAISEPALEARKAIAESTRFEALNASHTLTWDQLWRHFDFDIGHSDSDEEQRTEQILRLHILHLIQTTSPQVIDLDVGIPARGLHGEAYRGHIFWDELFVFPLFNLRMPEITRSLLRYRYRRLEEARRAARAAGYQGAMYPWQSGSNGREESQHLHLNPKSGNWIPDHSRLQRHINAAIVYNVWQYYQVTNDVEFLDFYGAEMIYEVARFWTSAVSYNETHQRYELRHVMGPDEYHDGYPGATQPGLHNNAYTNIMVVWVLCRALELEDILPAERFTELCESLQLDQDEFDHWDRISRHMRIVFHADGIISQFEGYEQLEEFDWEGYRDKYGDIQRLDRILEAEDDTPNRYKVSKQADVLMLFYLFSSEELGDLFQRLGYPFQYDTIPRNIDYYSQRISHGSTLSRVVHSWVLARANRPEAWPYFRQALESDVGDIQGGTTPEGIHTGAMAGTVDLIQRCFTGIEIRNNVLWLNPALPRGLNRLKLNLRYRQQDLSLELSDKVLRIELAPASDSGIKIGIHDDIHTLRPGEWREFRL